MKNSSKNKKAQAELKLNIGSGGKKLEGYINIDVSTKYKPDVVADICNLPFNDNSVDEIYTDNVLEHVDKFEKAMKEMHRVLKKSGKLVIIVPYANCGTAQIPQHLRYFSWISFNPFIEGDGHDDYYDFHFRKMNREFRFLFINKIIKPLADSHPWLYESTFLVSLFPAHELYVELTK